MKLKKFKQFVQNISEELTEEEFRQGKEDEKYDDVADFKNELGDDELKEDDFGSDEDEDDFDGINNPDEFDETEIPVETETETETEEEEEGHEYKGNILMRELADKLGTKVVDNQIEYNGKTINYYSETEKFHIGRDKFDTIEEVLDFVGSGDSEEIVGVRESADNTNHQELLGKIVKSSKEDLDDPIRQIIDLNLVNVENSLPLRVCVKHERMDLIKLLIDNGADPKFRSMLVLKWACEWGKDKVLNVLLDNCTLTNRQLEELLHWVKTSDKITDDQRDAIIGILEHELNYRSEDKGEELKGVGESRRYIKRFN